MDVGNAFSSLSVGHHVTIPDDVPDVPDGCLDMQPPASSVSEIDRELGGL